MNILRWQGLSKNDNSMVVLSRWHNIFPLCPSKASKILQFKYQKLLTISEPPPPPKRVNNHINSENVYFKDAIIVDKNEIPC